MKNKREFLLTDGKNFIKQSINGKYTQVESMHLADIFDSRTVATNVKLNSIPKNLSRQYFVAEVVNGEIVQCDVPRPQKAIKPRCNEGFCFKNELTDTKWHKGFIGLEGLFEDAVVRMQELSQEVCDIESQINDIEHYMEFTALNARDGYKVYRKLRELLCVRRCLKNEQKIVNAVNKNRSALEQIKNISNAIETGTGCEYKPRVFVDLFKNGIDAIS